MQEPHDTRPPLRHEYRYGNQPRYPGFVDAPKRKRLKDKPEAPKNIPAGDMAVYHRLCVDPPRVDERDRIPAFGYC
jgi:hypothetical protein